MLIFTFQKFLYCIIATCCVFVITACGGKKYTAKINAKGVAKFSIKLTKKGKYSAAIKFAGDNTYKASNKKISIIIK